MVELEIRCKCVTLLSSSASLLGFGSARGIVRRSGRVWNCCNCAWTERFVSGRRVGWMRGQLVVMGGYVE